MSQEQVLQIKGVRLWTAIPELGHYPWVEKPDEVKASLRQFVVDFIINDPT